MLGSSSSGPSLPEPSSSTRVGRTIEIGQVVEAYLTGLLSSTRGLYLAALQADRVPLQGTSDLSTWWGVEMEHQHHRFADDLPDRQDWHHFYYHLD